MAEKQHCVCPEFPHDLQGRRGSAEVQNRSSCRSQHHEGPQFSVPAAQQKRKGSHANRQTVAPVQRCRQPRKPSAKWPKHIVNHGKRQTQEDRLQKEYQLL